MSDSNFNKQLLTRYVETECKRKLFLELANVFPEKWYTDERKLERPKHTRKMHDLLLKLGKYYEQRVYSLLRLIEGTQYDTHLDPSLFLKLYDDLKNSPLDDLILLEFQFEVPESFLHFIFPPKESDIEIPVKCAQQRPDIMIIGKSLNKNNEDIFELSSDGTIQKVSESGLATRYGINIIDIKNTREDHIGKKQFIEIFYYLWTLSFYLKEHKLDDKFFVRIDNNGIFPQYDEADLICLQSLKDLIEFTIKIKWNDSIQIFTDTIEKIQKLWSKAPLPIDSTRLNIQPSCGHCYFLEDCKKTLGMNDETEPKDWSLKLIPYTSPSIAQQLIDKKFETIGDVVNNINSIEIGNTPNPLYSELPLLQNKALALLHNQIILPESGHTHTYTIPKFSPISITFAVETDPANNRGYAAGFFLHMASFANAQYSGVFDNWWKIWKDNFETNKTPLEIQVNLNKFLIRDISIEEVEYFLYLLKKLKITKELINLRGEETMSGKKRKQTQVILQFATINEGYDNATEAKFTKDIIKKLFYILELCNYIEKFVIVISEYKTKSGYYGPTTSLFYWSKRQLDNFQDMLERNLVHIIDDLGIWRKFFRIISLFTPSDSEVAHPYQHKKLFDVQIFTETMIGFPSIINYTWHEIANRLNKTISNRKFWIPHFNYMDFNNWYEMIVLEDQEERKKQREEIRKQIMHKVRTINSLRIRYQIESRYVISKYARVYRHEEISNLLLPSEFHSIAHVWYLFSKLTGSRQERDTDFYRTIYPEFSIGKLAAAKVSNLRIIEHNNKFYYIFQIEKLSSNMKLNIGSRVLLIPDEKRDMKSNRRMEIWKIIIAEMVWSSKKNGYTVTTEKTNNNLFEKIAKDKDIIKKPENLTWYLYNITQDVWSKKLYGNNGLLQRYNLGNSWLGERLAYIWSIRSKQSLKWPNNWNFTAPSVYLYAPSLLKQYSNSSSMQNDLLTSIDPTPDPSQKKAINIALDEVISGIQGPPGTGKSQTIAALIDEYYHRCLKNGKKSVKILITAFSYAAIRVLIKKIRDRKDKNGKPTKTSQLQMIFLRSEHQEPIRSKAGCRDIDDLTKHGSTWKLNNKPRSVTKTNLLEESLEPSFIMFANAHQLFYLPERVNDDFAFDFICVDEASQLPVDNFMSSLQFTYKHNFEILNPQINGELDAQVSDKDDVQNLMLKNKINMDELTKIVIVGDYYQLPPVQPVPPPKKLEKVLESLFAYYVKYHKIPSTQLQVNYRSHKHIVGFTKQLSFYHDLKPHSETGERTLEGDIKNIKRSWIQEVMDPKKVVSTIIHKHKFEIGVSELEAKIVVKLLKGYFKMRSPKSEEEERRFWREDVGVVAPHNAQGRLIIRSVFDELTNSEKCLTNLNNPELMSLLKATIYSVEKFQGSDRELIISSIGISDKDQLNAESEFIYNINRFNVLTSRAKCKVILVVSEKFLKFIPEERGLMEEAAQIHKYASNYCNKSKNLSIKNEKNLDENIVFRYKE